MRKLILAVMMWPCAALAWEPLDGPGIEAALNDRSLSYDAYTLQHFRADGVTDYITERASSGRWAARGDQYCSTWPPSDMWTCYDVELDSDQVRFTSADGTQSVGTYIE